MISTAWNTYVRSRYNKLVYLIWGGNSLINKNTSQTSVVDDLKGATPSVFIVKEIFAGLLCWQRKPLVCSVGGILDHHTYPWCFEKQLKLNHGNVADHCRNHDLKQKQHHSTSWRNMYILHGQLDTWKHICAHYKKMYNYTFELLF